MGNPDDVYEEWIAHPGQHAFVHTEDRWDYARRPGWWATERTYTAGAVQERGYQVQDRVRLAKPANSGPVTRPLAPSKPVVLPDDDD